MTTDQTVTWRIRMLSDTGTALDYAALYDCTEQQALIEAGAFAARMGNVHPRLVSATASADYHRPPPEATSPQTTPDNSETSNNTADNPTAAREAESARRRCKVRDTIHTTISQHPAARHGQTIDLAAAVWAVTEPELIVRETQRDTQCTALAGLVEYERGEAARLRGMLAEVVNHAFAPGVRSAVTVARIRRVFDRAAAERDSAAPPMPLDVAAGDARALVTGRPIGHAVVPDPGTGGPR